MKNNSPILARVAILSGFALGAFALSVLATDWTAPLSSPPNCASGNPGCDAPINVGSVDQTKTGSITTAKSIIAKELKTTSGPDHYNQGVIIGYNSISQSESGYGLVIKTDNNNLVLNPTTGNVGIGTLSPSPNSKLDVVGGPIKASGGLIIETRTAAQGNPANLQNGNMWLIVN